MDLLAATFDPGNDGIDVGDIVLLLTAITIGSAILAGMFRLVVLPALDGRIAKVATPIVAEIVKKIEDRTYPIQPTANGGLSLPDAIERIETVQRRQGEVIELLTELVAQRRHTIRD